MISATKPQPSKGFIFQQWRACERPGGHTDRWAHPADGAVRSELMHLPLCNVPPLQLPLTLNMWVDEDGLFRDSCCILSEVSCVRCISWNNDPSLRWVMYHEGIRLSLAFLVTLSPSPTQAACWELLSWSIQRKLRWNKEICDSMGLETH